jgi:hypothetical protein
MDKRYQVFISSTYADLKEERQHVIQTVIEANCIPAGMELFPAADEAQLAFIKRVIDDCDYYLLIIGEGTARWTRVELVTPNRNTTTLLVVGCG